MHHPDRRTSDSRGGRGIGYPGSSLPACSATM